MGWLEWFQPSMQINYATTVCNGWHGVKKGIKIQWGRLTWLAKWPTMFLVLQGRSMSGLWRQQWLRCGGGNDQSSGREGVERKTRRKWFFFFINFDILFILPQAIKSTPIYRG